MNSLSTKADSLGTVKKSLRPKKENLIAGYAIIFLFCCGAGYFLYTASQDFDPTKRYILGSLFLVAATGMAWFVRRLSRLTVIIHERGFVVHRGRSQLAFPWDSTQCVNEHLYTEVIPPLHGAAGVVTKKAFGKTTRSYTVVRDDGASFFFDDNVVPRGSLLAGPLRSAQRTRDFDWNIESI
tara:strand:+ start:15816 stop:16361 length:546 start_codon:yes stop_codon:yes gene_type:complete